MENPVGEGIGGALQHISIPASRVIDQIAEAAIRRALEDGDVAKARKFRRYWCDFVEEVIDDA